jgi:small GTP-binding protein
MEPDMSSFVQSSRYKLVIVGDISVGKTSIITQFVDNNFKDNYDPSIGVDFASKTIRFRGRYLKLQIWDTAGQEKYKSLIPSYIRGSAIVYIVYDITSKFNNIIIMFRSRII